MAKKETSLLVDGIKFGAGFVASIMMLAYGVVNGVSVFNNNNYAEIQNEYVQDYMSSEELDANQEVVLGNRNEEAQRTENNRFAKELLSIFGISAGVAFGAASGAGLGVVITLAQDKKRKRAEESQKRVGVSTVGVQDVNIGNVGLEAYLNEAEEERREVHDDFMAYVEESARKQRPWDPTATAEQLTDAIAEETERAKKEAMNNELQGHYTQGNDDYTQGNDYSMYL